MACHTPKENLRRGVRGVEPLTSFRRLVLVPVCILWNAYASGVQERYHTRDSDLGETPAKERAVALSPSGRATRSSGVFDPLANRGYTIREACPRLSHTPTPRREDAPA